MCKHKILGKLSFSEDITSEIKERCPECGQKVPLTEVKKSESSLKIIKK